MILLDGLQRFNGVRRVLSQQPVGAEVADARGDQFLGLVFNFLHRGRKVVVGMDHIPVRAMQNVELAGGHFDRIQLSVLVGKQRVIACGAV